MAAQRLAFCSVCCVCMHTSAGAHGLVPDCVVYRRGMAWVHAARRLADVPPGLSCWGRVPSIKVNGGFWLDSDVDGPFAESSQVRGAKCSRGHEASLYLYLCSDS